MIMGLKEVVYDFDEFKKKVDTSRSVHHDADVKQILPPTVSKLVFRMYGVSKDGHVLVFKKVRVIDQLQHPEKEVGELVREALDELERQFSKPLGSTPGRWEE